MYVKTTGNPCFHDEMNMAMLIVKDKHDEMISLVLYNQNIAKEQWWREKRRSRFGGIKIAIKQPYMNLSYEGSKELRNDNPDNIEFKFPKMSFTMLEDLGQEYSNKKEYSYAIGYYN